MSGYKKTQNSSVVLLVFIILTHLVLQPGDIRMWRAKVANQQMIQGMFLEILSLLGDQSSAIDHKDTDVARGFEQIQQHAPGWFFTRSSSRTNGNWPHQLV